MILEVCVDTPRGLAVAIEAGADRIELCSALSLGGLTPTPGLIALAARSPIPVYAMIRPRAGDFVFCEDEVEAMQAEIRAAKAAGLAGIAIGASRPDGTLDETILRDLIGEAAGLGMTLHRAFDLVPDPLAALETAVDLRLDRILTSGGALTAPQGIDTIAALVQAARGRISIMAGSGVTEGTVASLLLQAGVREVHASCRHPVESSPHSKIVRLGFEVARPSRTDGAAIRALRAAIDATLIEGERASVSALN